jgi:hypothetical protein
MRKLPRPPSSMDEARRSIAATLGIGLMLAAVAWLGEATTPSWPLRLFPALALFAVGVVIVVWAWRGRPAHVPPGGGLPMVAPVEYQVRALRQVIARIAETTDGFGRAVLDDVLRNLPRTGTDPIYEPLMAGTCQEGMAWLVEHGELADLGGSWIIRRP